MRFHILTASLRQFPRSRPLGSVLPIWLVALLTLSALFVPATPAAASASGGVVAWGWNTSGKTTVLSGLMAVSPTDISLSNASIAENQPAGATVGTFSTTDLDAGETYTYSLVTGTGSTDNVSFSITGSTLKTTAMFDYETKSSYLIRVRTTDNFGLWFEKQFTISVTNVNEAPTGITVSPSSVAENNINFAQVGYLTSTPHDGGETHTYSLVAGVGSTDNASFIISNTALRTNARFDYEIKNSYLIRVRTTDSLGFWFERQFKISIINENEAPTLNVSYGGTCASAGGTMNLTIADKDNTHPSLLKLSATSSNTTVVPTANITFGGTDANRTITITGTDQSGNATINITVSDGRLVARSTILFIKGTTSSQALTGGTSSNLILGMGGQDTLNGGASNDLLCGGSSTDRLNGLGGADTMTGGLGADFFSGGASLDKATDFTPSQGDTKDSTVEQY